MVRKDERKMNNEEDSPKYYPMGGGGEGIEKLNREN